MRGGERVAAVEALWGDTPVQQVNALAPMEQAPVAAAVAVEPAPPQKKGEEEVALMPMLGALSGGSVEAAPLPTAFLPQAWLFELRVQPGLGSEGVDVARGRTTLAVEGRVSERVALGTALAMRPGMLFGDDAAGGLPATALSASLSGRVRLTDHPAFRVLLAFDGTFAGPSFDEEARGLRLRPSLLAGMRHERWAFSTSQAYALRPGQAQASWDSSYQVWFLPLPKLALGAGFDALVDATPLEPGPSGYAAGVGARLKLGGFELGTSVRRGFGPDGARLWGGWSGQLTLGWSGLGALLPQ